MVWPSHFVYYDAYFETILATVVLLNIQPSEEESFLQNVTARPQCVLIAF